MDNIYEKFRTILVMNLYQKFDTAAIKDIIDIIDVTMDDFNISDKQKDIIPATDMLPIIKCYLAAKGIANLSIGTLKQYKYKLIHFFDTVNKPYSTITTNDIRMYLFNYKIEHNASDRYLENIRITINTFFDWLLNNNYIERNPCVLVDKIKYQEKHRQPLTTFNLEILRCYTETLREKALIDFLYSTGCRVSECANVNVSDINFDDNSVLLRVCKGGNQRTVYFNDEAKVSLQRYLAERKDLGTGLFVSTRKPYQQLKAHALENIIKKIGKRAGIEVYPHKLRHTFATVGLRNGIPLEELQTLLGHAKPETTLIYADVDKEKTSQEYHKAFN